MNKPFKLNIADGSSFSFHKDGSYDYHSFDGHDTTYQPVSDGDSGLDYAADAPVAHFKRGYGIPHDIKFADGNLIKELKWTFYYTDPTFDVIRNDGWTEKTYPNTNTDPGSAPITRDVVTSPDGKSYGLYFIGAGTLNKYGPWMYETSAGGWNHMVKYDDVTAPGARIVYTDPDHTVLPSDCSDMFADFKTAGIMDMSQIGRFDTSNVTNMSGMFKNNASVVDASVLKNWDTSKVTDMSSMFELSSVSDLSVLSHWNLDKVKTMAYMFSGTKDLHTLDAARNLSLASLTDMSYMFSNHGGSLDVSAMGTWDTSRITSMANLFDGKGGWPDPSLGGLTELNGVDKIRMDSVTDINNMFARNYALKSIGGIGGLDVSHVQKAFEVFEDCRSLTALDLSRWDTKNFTSIYNMFFMMGSGDTASKLASLDLTGWDTSQVTSMSNVFRGCAGLTSLPKGVADWQTGNVTAMDGMFRGCTVYSELGLSGMFSGDSSLETLKADGWKFAGVTAIGNMFNGTTGLKLLSLTDWDASNVDNLDNAFTGIGAESGMKLDLSNWKVNKNVSIDLSLRDTNVTAVDLSGWDTTVDNGFRPRFSARLNQLTVGPKTLLRPEYFAPGAEPATDSQYTGQWVEASAKKDATQTCAASDGTTYTAAGESWTSCGRPAGSSATESMRQHANDRASEATYLWEQHNTVHFAGLDPTNPRAPYDDSVMAPKQSYGVDATSIKVDGDTTPVDVHGMTESRLPMTSSMSGGSVMAIRAI
ncbi:MAG: BspA family leucine-rich repeat surface protein [Bifidobacterium sp.]|nr:BspA family leucine-rich repeat surface protein [Bifidobacterium sp.]